MSDSPLVGILVGSESDRAGMRGATGALDEAGVGYEFEVRSAHRTPDAVAEYARSARDRGLRVLICGAGLSAALPGAVAAQTDLPVGAAPARLAGNRRAAALEPQRARRPRRPAGDRPDASGGSRGGGRRRQRAQR